MTAAPTSVDIFSPEHKRDPFPFYARLRANAPVCQIKTPLLGPVWLITRYDDVMACLKDADRFVKDPKNAGVTNRKAMPWWLPASVKALEQNMLDVDDPGHRRLRNLVNKAFSRPRIEALREKADAIARDLLARIPDKGAADLVGRFALPFPLTIICELLGVPGADQHKFHKWSSAFLSTTSELQMVFALPAVLAFIAYLRRLIAKRRASPEDDLITALVQAEEEGNRLNERELVAMVLILLIAGHETTVNLIGSGTLALLENPAQRRALIDDPSLMPTAVDELLRYTAPVETATERYAATDVSIGGVTLRRGDLVLAVIASANRDERTFVEPDQINLARAPNPHLAFGDGIHYCLGHQLARMEAEIAFTRLFTQFPNMALAVPVDRLMWRKTTTVRGLSALPVMLGRSIF
jgi:cytochrome P450